MPRPNKILEPTKTYNLLMKEEQYDRLAYIAHQMQKTKLEQVAVADLIRDAIDIYLEVLEEEHETESKD
jgi:predicted DNA-binding protein|tara:strand:+ start:166 stop:372 length:207 start_codon:yes stop_codon:yes gene_type:complete